MSHFIKVAAAQFKDAGALCVALQAMGFAKEQIERYETPQLLTSRYSDRASCEIIVRRTCELGKHTGGTRVPFGSPTDCPTREALNLKVGDMGFKLNAKTGEYETYVESYDNIPAEWFTTLTQEYTAAVATQEYQALGLPVYRKNLQEGQIQLSVQCA